MGFGCFSKAQVQFGIKILSAVFCLGSASSAATTSAKHLLEEIGEITAIAKPFKAFKTLATASTKTAVLLAALLLLTGILFVLFAVLPVFAILIVFLTLFRVAQYLVGLVYLLEFFVGFGIVRVQVGMELAGQLSVSCFYIFFGGIFINAEYLIIINKGHIRVSVLPKPLSIGLSFYKYKNSTNYIKEDMIMSRLRTTCFKKMQNLLRLTCL